jgi:hypothetical protein
MSRAHSYRPRFVDIRIRPPEAEPEPHEKQCDWGGCMGVGECRAPKGPDKLRDYYWFCPSHAAEYNRSWNFFAKMSEDEVRAYQKAASTGHRPTWNMKTNSTARAKGSTRTHAGQRFAKAAFSAEMFDAFDLFGPEAEARREAAPRAAKLGRLETRAFETLGFDGRAAVEEVRARYTELVKRFHPDSNGGDRSTETRLQDVITAYKTLRKAGMA